jgi:polyisoprenoid-binding protein YceI
MSIFSRKSRSTTVANAAPVGSSAASTAVLDFEPATVAAENVSGDYVVDPTHTRIGFSTRHAMVTTVRGAFTEFEGAAHLDVANPANSSASLRIKVASVDTGQQQRDEHLRTGDFFDAEAYPEILFSSTSVEQLDADVYAVTGDLTIKDVTRPVTVEFTVVGSAKDPFGNLRVGFEGAATVNRKDWGLTYNAALETGGVLISDRIKLEFDVSAIATPAS